MLFRSRTPEANDRDAVGRSMGLTPDQVNEIAKLPSGVAVIYQNDWVNPVLCMIEKANVHERPYVNENPVRIKSLRESRSEIIRATMEPWIKGEMVEFSELASALNSIEVSRSCRKLLSVMIYTYKNHSGHIMWNENSIGLLKQLLMEILGIPQKILQGKEVQGSPEYLGKLVISRTTGFEAQDVEEICHILETEDK